MFNGAPESAHRRMRVLFTVVGGTVPGVSLRKLIVRQHEWGTRTTNRYRGLCEITAK